MAPRQSLSKNVRLGGPSISIEASRLRLQSNYTNGIITQPAINTSRVCNFFAQDCCFRGKKCKFDHDVFGRDAIIFRKETKLRDCGIFDVKKFCLFYNTGEQCKNNERGRSCAFIHDDTLRYKVIASSSPTTVKPNVNYAGAVKGNVTKPVVLRIENQVTTPNPVGSSKSVNQYTQNQAGSPNQVSKVNTGLQTPPATPHKNQKHNSSKSTPTKLPESPHVTKVGRPGLWALDISPLARARVAYEISGAKEADAFAEILRDFRKKADPNAKFKDFTLLPRELRDMVWKYALRKENWVARIKLRGDGWGNNLTNTRFVPQNFAPRLLHTCHESRELALKHYHRAFDTEFNGPLQYINFRQDWLFIHTDMPNQIALYQKHIERYAMDQVRWLQLSIKDVVLGDEKVCAQFIIMFKKLKCLVLLAGRNEKDNELVNFEHHHRKFTKYLYSVYRVKVPEKKEKEYPKINLHYMSAQKASYYKIDNYQW